MKCFILKKEKLSEKGLIMMKKPQILVIGSMNIDMLFYGINELPKWGVSICGSDYKCAVGGKGANQAFAAALQGADAYMVGRVGNDDNGRLLLRKLEEVGVHTDYIVMDDTYPTGVCSMNMGEEGRYFSINSLGANWQLKEEDLERALEQHEFDMIVMQLEMPLDVAYRTCALGAERKIPVFVDAGPAMSIPLGNLRGAFIISPNEAETEALTGIVPDSLEHIEEAAQKIYTEADPEYVLLKLGKQGAYLYNGVQKELIPGYSVNAIDTTAAGDTFGAAFCVQYCLGKKMHEAIRFAHAAAAVCVTRKGGQPSIPTQREAESFYQSQVKKIGGNRDMFCEQEYIEAKDMIIGECRSALSSIDFEQVNQYLQMLAEAEKVFFVGVGRVFLALECIAKRYAHLGIRSVVVGEITEPAITDKDVLIVGSGSGETLFPLGIARKAKKIGAKIIHIGSNPDSSMKEVEDLFVRIPVESRAKAGDEIHSGQPMTSLFEQSLLLFGDATASMMVKKNQINIRDLWQYHANLE